VQRHRKVSAESPALPGRPSQGPSARDVKLQRTQPFKGGAERGLQHGNDKDLRLQARFGATFCHLLV
jgi:hypothetical protein